ncbi:MAG: ZIP family metal transporter [Pseudomonadota bacterium]
MFQALQAPLLFGLIAAFVTSLGLLAVSAKPGWSERHANVFGLVAAGLLLTLALLHIVPEAFALSPAAPIWLTAGFFGGMALNQTARWLAPDEGAQREGQVEALVPILAIGVHSFIDGIIYAITFTVSFTSGLFAVVGLILHEFPEGVIAYAILRRSGVSNRQSLLFAFLAAAATTPLGVIVSGPFLQGLGAQALGPLFAISAGLLLFVATGPLMAPIREVAPALGFGAVGGGAGLAIGLLFLPLPGHDHGHIGHRHGASVPSSHGHHHSDGHGHGDDHRHSAPDEAPDFRKRP